MRSRQKPNVQALAIIGHEMAKGTMVDAAEAEKKRARTVRNYILT
jgi:hypothetical protein